MVQLLGDDGFQISVVTPLVFDGSMVFEEEEHEKIYRFPFWSENKLLIEYKKIPIFRMISYMISGILRSYFVVKNNGCALIHAHWMIPTGIIGVLVGKMLNRPVVVSVHGSDVSIFYEKRLIKKIMQCLIKHIDFFHSVASHNTKKLLLLGVEKERIINFPMGIDKNWFDYIPPSSQIKGRKKYTVINTRNLFPIYNVELLIKAIPFVVQKVKNIEFIIAGDGTEKTYLTKLSDDLKVTKYVKFIGRIPHAQIVDYLARSDIYISTSLSDGTSVSLLEAISCGLFPVVTDIPANREWIRNGENGFLVPTSNEKILAQRIIEALRDLELRKTARRKNLKIIKERALWSINIKKLEKLYEICLNKKQLKI